MGERGERARWPQHLVAAATFAAGIAWLSWPLPVRPRGVLLDGGPLFRADLQLVAWILGWGAHALASDPSRFFQGNIFHPAPDALASSEHLLGLAPVSAPIFLATGDALLAHNLTLLSVVFAACLGAYWAARELSGSTAVGVFGGVALGLSPLVTAGWNRLHVSAVHGFALILLLMWRAAATPRPHLLAGLAVAVALQVLAGIYVSFELLVLLLGFAPTVWWEARRHGRTGVLPACAAVLGALTLLVVVGPYLRLRAAGGLSEFTGPNATILLAFDTPEVVWRQLLRGLEPPLCILAVLGALWPGRTPWHLRAGLAAASLLGIWFALGPAIAGPYTLAERAVPGFASLRNPLRFLAVPIVGGSLLAALGADALLDVIGLRGRRRGLALAVMTAGLLVLRTPGTPHAIGSSPVADGRAYAWLAAHGDGRPLLEIPVCNSPLDFGRLVETTGYMLASTLHWLPLVNGYSGHPPPSNGLLMTLAQRLPDPDAFADVCRFTGIGWLLVHSDRLSALEQSAWTAEMMPRDLIVVARFGPDVIYRVFRSCGADVPRLVAELGRDDGRTLDGLPRSTLTGIQARGRVRGRVQRVMAGDVHTWIPVQVTNRSRTAWPGLSSRYEGTLGLSTRWRDPRSGAIVLEGDMVPLARDLRPAARLSALVGTFVPGSPGTYDLEVGLVQDDRWFVDLDGGRGLLRARIEVRSLGQSAAGGS